jgi:RND superfamily putative drug exporter
MNVPGLVVRRRRWIALTWVLVAALLLPRAGTVSDVLEAGVRVEGSGSAEVDRLLTGPLASPFAHSAVLVVRGIPAPTTAAGDSALRTIVDALDDAPEVADTFSFLNTADSLFLVPDSSGTFIVVGLAADGTAPDVLVPALRGVTERLVPTLQGEHPDVTLRWTGETPLNVDLRKTSGADVAAAEHRALPVTAGLLLLAFGAVAAALLPVMVGTMAIAIALGAAAIVAQFVSLSLLLQSVVSMLGLGLGIDYALLMVSRFREALAGGDTVEASAEAAARHAGHTILLSAATVALGFLVLLLVPLNEIRAVAVGGLLVVISSSLLATTLLPGVLAFAGTKVNWGRVGRRRSGSEALRSFLDPGLKRWRQLGHWVTAHPWRALIGGATPLILLSLPALLLRTGLPTSKTWDGPASSRSSGWCWSSRTECQEGTATNGMRWARSRTLSRATRGSIGSGPWPDRAGLRGSAGSPSRCFPRRSPGVSSVQMVGSPCSSWCRTRTSPPRRW